MEKFDKMSKEELLAIIWELRENLKISEDANDYCMFVAETLDVDVRTGK